MTWSGSAAGPAVVARLGSVSAQVNVGPATFSTENILFSSPWMTDVPCTLKYVTHFRVIRIWLF